MHLKTYAQCGMDVELFGQGGCRQSDRQHGLNRQAFDDVRIDLVERDAEELTSARTIVDATLANRPLIARTTLDSERYSAVIEYPVKTMNANERDMIYQTDTGPVLFPDLEGEFENMIAGFELAFAAFNCPDWTEFIIRAPTQVAGEVRVQHYSRKLRVDCSNQVFAL
jgi:hypothetical protein